MLWLYWGCDNITFEIEIPWYFIDSNNTRTFKTKKLKMKESLMFWTYPSPFLEDKDIYTSSWSILWKGKGTNPNQEFNDIARVYKVHVNPIFSPTSDIDIWTNSPSTRMYLASRCLSKGKSYIVITVLSSLSLALKNLLKKKTNKQD